MMYNKYFNIKLLAASQLRGVVRGGLSATSYCVPYIGYKNSFLLHAKVFSFKNKMGFVSSSTNPVMTATETVCDSNPVDYSRTFSSFKWLKQVANRDINVVIDLLGKRHKRVFFHIIKNDIIIPANLSHAFMCSLSFTGMFR